MVYSQLNNSHSRTVFQHPSCLLTLCRGCVHFHEGRGRYKILMITTKLVLENTAAVPLHLNFGFYGAGEWITVDKTTTGTTE